MSGPPAPRRAVVIGGTGAVGGMLVELLASFGARVSALDRVAPSAELAGGATYVPYDAERPGAATLLAGADLVVLALPEPVALAVAPRIAGEMDAGGLLVQTLSVQSGIAERLRAPQPVEVLGLNPLFAPALGIAGRGVAAVGLHPGPRTDELLGLLAGAGARVVRLGWEEHDRAMAAAQVLTHAAVLSFGLALRELGADVSLLGAAAPPPHRALLALLARIAGGTPEVYWDIQAANPFAHDARAALCDGVGTLSTAIERDGRQGFDAALATIAGLLDGQLDEYRRLSNDLLAGLRDSAGD